jgi:putative transposase
VAKKKAAVVDPSQKKSWIDRGHSELSIASQCRLLHLPRSSLYYEKAPGDPLDLKLMRLIDQQYLRTPFYGSRRMRIALNEMGFAVGREKAQSLMRTMGIEAIYPKPNLSRRNVNHKIYPYLLRNVTITRVNQVWSADITYLPLENGFAFLVAVIDWFSRYVLSWRISPSLETSFCIEALEDALRLGTPGIFNTDQGCQFTSKEFVKTLLDRGIQISMDSKGRALDNVFIERLWRSYKYEDLYIKGYKSIQEVKAGTKAYMKFYCYDRPHQSLSYKTPYSIFCEA